MTPAKFKQHKKAIRDKLAAGDVDGAITAFNSAAAEMADNQVSAMMQMIAMDIA